MKRRGFLQNTFTLVITPSVVSTNVPTQIPHKGLSAKHSLEEDKILRAWGELRKQELRKIQNSGVSGTFGTEYKNA